MLNFYFRLIRNGDILEASDGTLLKAVLHCEKELIENDLNNDQFSVEHEEDLIKEDDSDIEQHNKFEIFFNSEENVLRKDVRNF